ncbi:MAG: aminotransferase class V-fold PLP-dependent enzyme, partial [Aeoliella sp.]
MKMDRTSEIYLDENATTRVLPEAALAAQEAMEELFGNPSSSHITGLRARNIMESTRRLAREVLGATDHQIVFTSGATEAIQTAIFSTLCHVRETRRTELPSDSPRLLLYGATEHKAVPEALEHWNQILEIGDELLPIPVDRLGRMDLDFLREHASRADIVCTMAVNNETGVIQDLPKIEEVLRSENSKVMWLADCVQAVGKMPFDLASTTIDYAAISGHKVYAPKGVGMLIARGSAPLTPLIAGGGQEQGARSGTENLPGVAALGRVLGELVSGTSARFRDIRQLAEFRDRLRSSLERALPNIVFNTPFDVSVPTTINFSVSGFTSKEILDLFDAADLRVSSGSACGSALQASYVLEAMGLPQWQCDGAIRISFGPTFTEDDVAAACCRIEAAGRALSDSCLVISDARDMATPREIDGVLQLKKGSMCTWMLFDEATRECVIIDPFDDFCERIETFVRCKNAQIVAILDTHNHVDHDSCRKLLIQVLDQYT